MLNPLGTARDFAEPIGALLQSAVRPRARSEGTILDLPVPALPPGFVDRVPGAGELFFRDTGAPAGRQRGTILLLHGWMVPTDVHWIRTFEPLHRRGWRVVALDARGHGRGLRSTKSFRLSDCASDAAALVEHLGCGPVTVVGYSMGGIIAQLFARDSPRMTRALVLAATAAEFRDSLHMRLIWQGMGLLQIGWRLAPRTYWSALARTLAVGDPQTADWVVAELARGASWDIAEAGREIGRFDSRPWLGEIDAPAVVVLTKRDLLVTPGRQRALAKMLDAPLIEIAADHLAPATSPVRFQRALEQALTLTQREALRVVA